MLILLTDSIPTTLKGQIRNLFLEIKTGIFIGKVSAVIRERIWEKIKLSSAGGMLIYDDTNEQGFTIRTCGKSNERIVNIDGLFFVKKNLKTSTN